MTIQLDQLDQQEQQEKQGERTGETISSSTSQRRDATPKRGRMWLATAAVIGSLAVGAGVITIGGSDSDRSPLAAPSDANTAVSIVDRDGLPRHLADFEVGTSPADLSEFEALVATAQSELAELHRQVDAGMIGDNDARIDIVRTRRNTAYRAATSVQGTESLCPQLSAASMVALTDGC